MREFFTFKTKRRDRFLAEEEWASTIFPTAAYDEESGAFVNDDKTLSFGFICSPLIGTSEKIEQQVQASLNENYPKGSQAQYIYFRSPDVVRKIAQMVLMREGHNHPLFSNIIRERASFFENHTDHPLIANTGDGTFNLGYVFDAIVVVTFKMPIPSSQPTPQDFEDATLLMNKIKTNLDSVRLRPAQLTADSWVRYMQVAFNWGTQSAWRFGGARWDKSVPLSDQVLDYENDIEITKEYLRFGKQYVKCLSAKKFPSETYFGSALNNVGDLSGTQGGVKHHYMVVCNIYFPDSDGEKQSISRQYQYSVNQATGPIAKFVPVLLDKKNDFDTIYSSLNEGKRPLKVSYHVIVFGDSVEEVERAATSARNFWRTNRFEIMVDKYWQMPIFLNCLPFGFDAASVSNMKRHKTLTCKEASPLLPIFGEWKGTGTPHLNLISRNGQLMSFSLHDTTSNMNCLIAAESGSGKSFLANELLCSYMSEGAQVWVIDVGRSYEKLCNILQGEFIHFGSTSNIGLNPFPLVQSLDGSPATRDPTLTPEEAAGDDDGDEDAVVGLLEAMAAPTEKLTDYQKSQLRKAVNAVWCKHFRNTTVDLIQEELLAHEDKRVQDVGHQLFAFSSKGAYGRFFSGPNTLQFTNQLTVLELEELKGRKHLQAVVLLQLIYRIQQDVYLGARDRKKLCLVDECWEHLSSGEVANFLEHAYRRMRKYGSSIAIITQSIRDVYESPTGRAIAENSSTVCLLGQKSESIEYIRRQGYLQLSEYDFEQLKTVHTIPGVYSEVFIKSSYGLGIGRLIVNDFCKLLYSTNATDVHEINLKRQQGLSVVDAIYAVLEERKQRRRLAS